MVLFIYRKKHKKQFEGDKQMATQKQVTIIARYAHKTNGKLNGTVTYLVRASNGVDTYCTTLIDGQASGCSCPSTSKKGCYHKHQLEAKEAARPFAAKKLPVWTSELVKTGKLVIPGKARIIKQAVEAVVPAKKDMMKAALTTNQGFQLMR
jgi:hypothetical protein